MKEFNKVKFLESMGLLNRQFNYQSLQFERSTRLSLRYYGILFVKVIVPLKVTPLFKFMLFSC